MKIEEFVAHVFESVERPEAICSEKFHGILRNRVKWGREILAAGTIVPGTERKHSWDKNVPLRPWTLTNVSTTEIRREHDCVIIREVDQSPLCIFADDFSDEVPAEVLALL